MRPDQPREDIDPALAPTALSSMVEWFAFTHLVFGGPEPGPDATNEAAAVLANLWDHAVFGRLPAESARDCSSTRVGNCEIAWQAVPSPSRGPRPTVRSSSSELPLPEPPGPVAGAAARSTPEGAVGVDGASPPPPGPALRRPVPRIWWIAGPVLVALIAAVSVIASIQLPYITLSPGSARSANAEIRVAKRLVHRSKGGILFTTVSVRQPTGLEALLGVLDDDVEVDPLEVITGGQSQDKNEKFNLALMHDSKEKATKAALEKLGYKVGQKPVGAVISDIDPKVPAFKALTPGDTVIQADGKPVRSADELVALLRTHRPGDTVSMRIRLLTDSAIRTVRVPTIKRPGEPNRAFLGVSLETLYAFQFPVKVTVNSGDVGGPSAGLAYTLAIIDQLTPGSLTGGHIVAVTGTMELGGKVGEVGGVHQKTLAAIDAGATLMIVPTGEYADAKSAAHGKIRVEKADTLDQALQILVSIGGNADQIGKPGAAPTTH